MTVKGEKWRRETRIKMMLLQQFGFTHAADLLHREIWADAKAEVKIKIN